MPKVTYAGERKFKDSRGRRHTYWLAGTGNPKPKPTAKKIARYLKRKHCKARVVKVKDGYLVYGR